MRQSHLIISNTLIIWVSRVLLLIPQLILVPFLVHRIGDAGYGVYALIWSLTISIEQLQRSLQSGVVKYSAAFLAQGRMDKVNRIVSSSFIYSLFLAILAGAGILLSTQFFSDPTGDMASSLIVVGLLVFLVFPTTPYVGVIQSRQYYFIGAIAETASKYISLFLVVIWFKAVGSSVLSVVVIMSVLLLISRLVQVPIAYRLVPGLRNRTAFFDWRSFLLITSFGAAIVLASLCLAVNSTGLRWLMAALVSTGFVAHMAIMLMPGVLLSQIIEAATITVMPATSAYEATRNRGMLQELLVRGMRYTTMVVLAGMFAGGLLMRNALNAWVGPGYEFLAPYAIILFASVSFMLSTSTGHHMLKGMEKLRAVVTIYFFGLVLVPIGVVLAVFFAGGNPYVAVTAGLASGHLVCGCAQFVYCTREVGAELGETFKRVYAQPLLVAGGTWAIALGLTMAMGIDSLTGRLGASVAAVSLFLGCCYVLIFTRKERHEVRELLQLAGKKIGFS